MVKPHGGLVSVSFTPCGVSTSDLSTWSSSRCLQGSCDPGRSHLVEGFTLRCFQRFSLPHIATERCRWHDNSYTRGASNPAPRYKVQPTPLFRRHGRLRPDRSGTF